MKPKFLAIGRWLFILCIPVLLIVGGLVIAANSQWVYESGANKGGVSQILNNAGLKLTDAEIDKVYAELIRYFNSGDDFVSIMVTNNGQPFSLFTREETIHFSDVKNLIRLGYGLILSILAYLVAYALLSWRRPEHRKQQGRAMLWGGGLTLVVLLLFGLGMVSGAFDAMLLRFHLLFFTNPYWYTQGYMLLFFPEVLLRDGALLAASIAAGGAVVLGGVGWMLAKRSAAQ